MAKLYREYARCVHGQPQCLKNVIMVGFPSACGRGNFSVDGAFAPMCGTGAVSRYLGDSHDAASCWKVIACLIQNLSDEQDVFEDWKGWHLEWNLGVGADGGKRNEITSSAVKWTALSPELC